MNSSLTLLPKQDEPKPLQLIHLGDSSDGSGFILKVFNWSYIILVACVAYQVLFFWSRENAVAMGYVIFAWILFTRFFLTSTMLKTYPLSTFIILGYTATQFYFPLLFTSIELKPLVFNLTLPYDVFFHSALALLVLLVAHYLYRFLPVQSKRGSGSMLKKAGFFKAPGELQLWLMGLFGLAANIYVFLYSTSLGTTVTGGAGDKLIQAFLPFSYAPYFIPFTALYGQSKPAPKKMIPMLIAFTIALFVISIIRNSRGAFMVGFTSVGFAYLLGLLLGIFKPPVIAFKSIIIGLLGFWLVTGPLADLGTAMVIVRGQRNDISKAELLTLTLEAYKNKKAIILRRMEDKAFESDWDERYLDNLFTARFSNIKFNDASLVQAKIVGDNNPAMRKYSLDYIWGALPSPILKMVKPDVDKEAVYSTSFGDYIYNLAGAGASAFGGFRSGHFAGSGMAAFGWWYLAILGAGMIPVFFLFDKLSLKTKVIHRGGKFVRSKLNFSICGLIALTYIFQFLPNESVVIPINFLLRGYIQMLLLYFLIFHVTRIISNLISRLYS